MELRAFVAIVLLLASVASGRLYTIPENWTATIEGNSLPGFGGSGSYILVRSPRSGSSSSSEEEFLVSDNGTFGLAFQDFNGTGNLYLSVMMGVRNATSAAPIWTANRRNAVSNQSRLTNTDGELKLLDDSGPAWSPTEQKVASIGLEETGNLLLYNESGGLVWQSFDHPTNVLLPDQRLVTGQVLTSSTNSSTMFEGAFTASMEMSGIVLAFNTRSGEQEPYFLWSLRQPSTIASTRVGCPGYVAVLRLTSSGLVNMSYEASGTPVTGSACNNPLTVGLASGSSKRHFRLEYDGNLVSYRLNGTGSWETEYVITSNLGHGTCDLPLTCGTYGICEAMNKCQCLGNGTTNVTTSQSTSCGVPSWPSRVENCDTKYETDFVVLSGVRYFTNQYTDADRVAASLDECLGACRLNCSCSALVYNSFQRFCYFVKEISGSLTQGEPAYTAYIKYQDHSRLVKLKPVTSNSRRNLIVIASTVAAATVVIASSLLLLRELRRKQNAEIKKLLTSLQGPPQRFTYRALVVATKNFSKHVGTGGFGSVYEGTLRDGRKLAVKKLHSTRAQKQFIAEVASLGTVSHVNIVRLCGFCAELSHRLLVYEFMPNGSLDKWIFRNQEEPLDWHRRHSIALGTARGLAYLHEESREPIIHLDIKPQNILLDENFEAKVGDFGMAKLLISRNISQIVTGVRGTPGYLAPEWLFHSTATKKCDVYSYGMVLLEMIGGRRNLDPEKIDSDLSFYFPAWAVNEIRGGRLINVVDPRIRSTVDDEGAQKMIKVAFWCIQENPADRPSMDAVVQMLEGRQAIPEPPLDFRFSVEAPGMISIKASSDNIALGYYDSEKMNGTTRT